MMIRLPKLSLIFLTVVAAFVACEKKENASSKTISDGSKVDLSSFIPEHEISTEEIEPGDRLSVLVEVENPGDLDELQRLNFGGNSIYLEWDKKREGLYAEFVAPEFNNYSKFDRFTKQEG